MFKKFKFFSFLIFFLFIISFSKSCAEKEADLKNTNSTTRFATNNDNNSDDQGVFLTQYSYDYNTRIAANQILFTGIFEKYNVPPQLKGIMDILLGIASNSMNPEYDKCCNAYNNSDKNFSLDLVDTCYKFFESNLGPINSMFNRIDINNAVLTELNINPDVWKDFLDNQACKIQ